MQTNKTDKKILTKGLKTLLLALFCLFIGPILISLAFLNKEKSLYIPILIIGCSVSACAIFLIFKGISTIMDSMFKK
jgi:hypothetical protein